MLRALAVILALAVPASAGAQEIRFNVVQESLALNRADIDDAKAELHRGQWVVAIRLSDAARAKFGEITARGVGRVMQVVVGDRVVSAPVIREPIRGGSIIISGSMSEADAKAIAARLK